MTLQVIKDGITQEQKKARKVYRCKCGELIRPGDLYYCRYYGSGLGALKFPDKLCLKCGEKEERDGN